MELKEAIEKIKNLNAENEVVETIINALTVKATMESIEVRKDIIKFCEEMIKLIKKTNPENKEELLTIALGIKIGYELLIIVQE